jgi:hypothetical protein
MIGVRRIFDLGKIYERLGIVVFDIRVDARRYPPWRIAGAQLSLDAACPALRHA